MTEDEVKEASIEIDLFRIAFNNAITCNTNVNVVQGVDETSRIPCLQSNTNFSIYSLQDRIENPLYYIMFNFYADKRIFQLTFQLYISQIFRYPNLQFMYGQSDQFEDILSKKLEELKEEY